MKVIINIVANHTSWDSVLMKNPEYYATRRTEQATTITARCRLPKRTWKIAQSAWPRCTLAAQAAASV